MNEEDFKKWTQTDNTATENFEDIDDTPKLRKMKVSDPQEKVETKKEEAKSLPKDLYPPQQAAPQQAAAPQLDPRMQEELNRTENMTDEQL